MTTRTARDDEWAARFLNPAPLDARLYGQTGTMCTQEGVQAAPTVTQLIAWSGVPREMWYAPPTEPKPTVPKDVADDVAVRVLQLRRRYSRTELMPILGVASVSAVVRLETGRVHISEVDAITAVLDKVGV